MRAILCALVLLVSSAPTARAESPWIPPAGTGQVDAYLVHQEFDEFWLDTDRTPFPFGGEVHQQSFGLHVDYGVSERFAIDARLGYARVDADASIPDEDGIDDAILGVRWLVVDEFDERFAGWPSLALRLGAGIRGSYDTNGFLTAPGDGASHVGIDFSAGKQLGHDLVAWGSAGFRDRHQGVPDDWRFELGLAQSFLRAFDWSLAWNLQRATHGRNVNDVTFTLDKSPRLEEVYQRISASLGYRDVAGRLYRLSVGHTFDGKNSPKTNAIGISVSIPIDFNDEL